MSQCQHTTLKGIRCSRPANDKGKFCWQHQHQQKQYTEKKQKPEEIVKQKPEYLTYQPEEIIRHVSSALDPRSLSKLSGVSKRLHTIVQPIITEELKEKVDTFLKEKYIPAFYVVYPEYEEEEDGGGMSWTFENIDKIKTIPSKNSVYLWNVDKPIQVKLPVTGEMITFEGLTTVQQFVDAILKKYHDKGITNIEERLGDHHFYEGLHKVQPGQYEMSLGS